MTRRRYVRTMEKGDTARFEEKIVRAVAGGPLPKAVKITEVYERPRKKTRRAVRRSGR